MGNEFEHGSVAEKETLIGKWRNVQLLCKSRLKNDAKRKHTNQGKGLGILVTRLALYRTVPARRVQN